jgi:hypothetical protein
MLNSGKCDNFMQMINLNGTKMIVVQTAENGVVNKDTVFTFTQQESTVYGEYIGGKIKKGFLVGRNENRVLTFSYCQLQTDGTIDNGQSSAKLSLDIAGKIILVEHFEWKSRPGERGVNIFQEI